MENLQVSLIYLYPKENAEQHKTTNYEIVQDAENPIPVFRRGLKFTMAINFSGRGYDEANDIIKIIFNFGKFPNVLKGTKGVITVHPKKAMSHDDKLWYGNILQKGRDHLTLEVFTPVDCPVGNWQLTVETKLRKSDLKASSFEYENDVFVLFNPWICGDLTCMPDQRLLDEYVLNDVGKIWVGPWGSCRGREWVFGQFDAYVLPSIMFMFEKSGMPAVSRGDPIKVARMISKMVNSNDDDGILVGRWDGEYEDGTPPAGWTGSAAILEEYFTTKQPVKYGQCWVFSGVVTTICRALGIPSRVVSNLVSAHDANASLTVDKYFNANNEEIEDPLNEHGEDSIWNYHVWNDVWMARPDLPKGYGGWQAVDATPQEVSHGFYQCGPASVEAIKQGQVGYNYDVPFMVASVNADLMRWKEDPKCELGYSKIYCNKHHIGKMVITKQPFIFDPNGDRDKMDITNEYKQKEGTEAERISLYNAIRGTALAKTFYALPDAAAEDITFELEDLEKIKMGEIFAVSVRVKNNSAEPRTVNAVLSTGSVFYTGLKAKEVKKVKGSFKLAPKQSETLSMKVTPDEYMDKLVEYCNMKLYAVATVSETRQTWADEDEFQILKPSIEIKIPAKIPIGKPTKMTLTFKNPLRKILKNCKIFVSGNGLMRNQMIKHPNVNPGDPVFTQCVIVPKTEGKQKIIATFSSNQVVDISGTVEVDVVTSEE